MYLENWGRTRGQVKTGGKLGSDPDFPKGVNWGQTPIFLIEGESWKEGENGVN